MARGSPYLRCAFVFEVEDLSRATPERFLVGRLSCTVPVSSKTASSCYRRLHAQDSAFADAAQQLFAHDGIVGRCGLDARCVMQSPSPEQALNALTSLLLAARDDAATYG